MSTDQSFDGARVMLGLWRRSLGLPDPATLSPEMVRRWTAERGLNPIMVEATEVGTFTKTPAIAVEFEDGFRGYLPTVPADHYEPWSDLRTARAERAEVWRKVEWFEPLWVPQKRVAELLNDVRNRDKDRALELFNYHTSTIYTVPFEAVCVAQLIPKCRSLTEFQPLIREAFLAFFSGYRASGIAALIPLLEGALTRMAPGAEGQRLNTVDAVERACTGAITKATSLYFRGGWAPREYRECSYLFGLDERVYVFETFRRWLRESFFENTGEYSGATWLNRHLYAHGMSASWQQSSNFSRLIVALTTLGVIESWSTDVDGVSLFFPEMDDDGHLLWQEALFRGESQLTLNRIREQRYHAKGRLVPEFPTDNGASLRRALLADDCINDLVRPLRNAGWNVDMDDAEDSGLYVTLRASSGTTCFGLALLYSCATANQTYKSLAKNADVILYRGAPYHQDKYAYGVAAHVGPVAGWRPPIAPNVAPE